MPHCSKHTDFPLLFTTADGIKKIPWVVTWGDRDKQLLKVTSVALLLRLLQGTTGRGKEIHRGSIDGIMHTCVHVCWYRGKAVHWVTIQMKKLCGEWHRKCSLSVQALSVQQHFGSSNSGFQYIRCVTWEGELKYEEGGWCMELILRISSKACSPPVRWRAALKCCRSLSRCGFTSPAESALSYAGLYIEEGSIWCVNGIPAQPLLSRCRAQSLGGCFL